MKYFLRAVSVIGLSLISQTALSDPITDSYNTGDTLTATTLNNIKSAVNDNDSNITTNTTAIAARQNRITGVCPPEQSIGSINADGSVVCEVDSDSGGDITGVTAGTGLTGGGDAGTVSLSLAPSTEIIAVPAEAFVHQGGGAVSTSAGNGGAYIASVSADALVTPLYLPDGAVITDFSVWVEDNAVGDLSVALQRRFFATTFFFRLSTLSTTGAATGIVELNSGTLDITVDNSTSNYFLRAFSSSWPGDASLRINGARITYTR